MNRNEIQNYIYNIAKVDVISIKNINKLSVQLKAFNEGVSPVEVTLGIVRKVLNKYLEKEINKDDLLNWVNLIWFSDYFFYKASERDLISDYMEQLEQLDEVEDYENIITNILKMLNK